MLTKMCALARTELIIQRRELSSAVVLIVMPLMFMIFTLNVMKAALLLDPLVIRNGIDVSGADQAVPGFTVMFGFFIINYGALSIFREHGWNTWDRLRASGIGIPTIIGGKLLVPLILGALQILVLFGVGAAFMDLHVRGSVLALVLVCASLLFANLGIMMALVALCPKIQQIYVFSNLFSILFAGIGGAIQPIGVLPNWAEAVAPITPHYWAMRGMREVILLNGDVGSVLVPCAVLLAIAGVLFVVAVVRFDSEQTKVSFA